VQTAEGELEVEMPRIREAAETFAAKLFPRTPKLLRTEPLKALVIGAFVRGLSMVRSNRCASRPGRQLVGATHAAPVRTAGRP